MNSGEKPTNSDPQSRKTGNGRHFVNLLGVLVGIESLLVLAGAAYFFSQMFIQEVNNFAGAVVIFAITLFIGLGLVSVAIAAFRRKPWTRGAIITWQILQFAAATSFIRGISEWQSIGWVLMVLAAGTFVLVFVPSVTREMTKEN
ncbi:hypothetical protein [Aurantimicrobium minutum]|uniref:hypothetical protein n=1 Tax=Aurantimicrobium minutum TaxID=708131 RepID=UPI00248EB252|nr:hypothetical protein [Aurantimicrobium minutum]